NNSRERGGEGSKGKSAESAELQLQLARRFYKLWKQYRIPKFQQEAERYLNSVKNQGYKQEAVKGLREKIDFRSTLLDGLPAGYILGKVANKEDSFFDALAQSINSLPRQQPSTAIGLRMHCFNFYDSNQQLVDRWNQEYNRANGQTSYFWVGSDLSTCEEISSKAQFILGSPEVEGRILCQQLGL
ncbi:hypothetical protein GR268_44320, partial [Rhizobium leguminosarum]|nr:hypothetical protein [Rhizobium leguminosarum]